MGIDNTTRRMQDPAEQLLFLADSLGRDDASSFITDQEAAGQRQLVNSDRLPSEAKGDRGEWEALGFRFGDPDPDDPMFMPATLPDGWKRVPSDHDMWSHVIDQHGRKRVSVFYKAAFYDRSAFMRLDTLHQYTWEHVEHGAPLVITDEWATGPAVIAAMREHVAENRKEAGEFREYAADTNGRRDEDNRARCAEIAQERDATAAKYEAAIANLEGEGDGH